MLDVTRKEYPRVLGATLAVLGISALATEQATGSLVNYALLTVCSGGVALTYLLRLRSLQQDLLEAGRRTALDASLTLQQLAIERDTLQHRCREYRELVENANSIIMRWDRNGIIRYANDYTLRFFGYAEDEFIGHPVVDTIVPRTESTGRDLAFMIEDIGRNPERYALNENENIRKDRRRVWVAWTNKAIRDEQGNTLEILSVGNDVTEKKHFERRIHQLAHYDHLTQLPNRRLFADHLHQAIGEAQRHGREFAVLYLNLDRFKSVNDSLGHHRGDLLLTQVVDRMRNCLRQADTLARMDGDEFAIMLAAEPGRDAAVASAVAATSKLIQAITAPFALDDHQVFLNMSTGIATYPHDGDTADALIKHADTAMYRAKRRHDVSHLLFDVAMSQQAIARMNLENALRGAITENQLQLHYQPALNLHSRRLDYVEALLRWVHPALGHVPPCSIIDVAEERGLMTELGIWVLRTATRQAALWQSEEMADLMVAINISPTQFEDRSIVEHVQRALADSGLPAQRLALELTESTIVADSDYAQSALQQLSDMGVTLLIDDFGTGYSSLARLRSLPINTVKIDRSFLLDLTTPSAGGTEIVDAIIAMAHSLNLQVIAEGVETLEQMRYLEARDCDHIQGFLVSEALSADAVPGLLAGSLALSA